MKAMYAAFAATVVISIAGYYTLGEMGFSSGQVFSSESVRLDSASE
jgi:hypothetical protein